MRIFHHVGIGLSALLLSACTTPELRYYSLLPATHTSLPRSQPGSLQAPEYAISVQEVVLPLEVDRPQLLFSQEETTELIPLNTALWASPLADQVRTALTGYLVHELNVLELTSGIGPSQLPAWLIDVRVHRFQSLYKQRAVLDVSWQLNPVNMPSAVASLCGAHIQVPVQQGINAMVQGHQLALHELARLISEQLSGRTLSASDQKVVLVNFKGCTDFKKPV